MKVLVVGSGAREHAIAWKLAQSPCLGKLFVAPGNAGTADAAENVPVEADDVGGLLKLAGRERIDLTVVGPEAPLGLGIADRFEEAGLLLLGPTKAAARIETSKSFAKGLMERRGVPTARYAAFQDYDEAVRYVRAGRAPVVIKADGLTAGKGVVVAETHRAAVDALRERMVARVFGASGDRVLVEERLEGPEVSVFAFVDGPRVSPPVAACDYKRAGEGDTGPNTGGIGAYSPPLPSLWNADLEERVMTEIMAPVAKALADEGSPYRGVLYAGLMITEDGPKVIEFNCRLGDPEAQVVLRRLESDLLEAMTAAAEGRLEDVRLEWDAGASVGVVVASGGYPQSYETGYPIEGLDRLDDGVVAFHAGTALSGGRTVTDGGRVLTIASLADNVEDARRIAYANAERVGFEGAYYRPDIAALGREPVAESN